MQYIDWLALQLLPDTAEREWLDRHGHIWLVNADGSTGRKLATLAAGEATFTAIAGGAAVPNGTQLMSNSTQIAYETTADIVASTTSSPAPIRALDPGALGNLDPGATLSVISPVPGVSTTAYVVELDGGTDDETDEELRARVLERIRQPPMGGDAEDYVRWALSVPGVTRAWCAPLEMGMGTVTVRFMMDDLRADNDGFPNGDDIATVAAYLDTVRPVAVKDFFVEAPIPCPVNFTITNLVTDNPATRQAIEDSVAAMIFERAAPGTTIWQAWVSEAIASAPGVDHFGLEMSDFYMPNPGSMGVLGDVVYA